MGRALAADVTDALLTLRQPTQLARSHRPQRGDEVNNTLKATGESLMLDLSLRGGDVVVQLEQTGAQITDRSSTRSDTVGEAFNKNAESWTNVGARGDRQDMLVARLRRFEEMFSHGGAELAEKIGRDSATLGNLITRTSPNSTAP